MAHPAEKRRGTSIGVPTDSCGAKKTLHSVPLSLPLPLLPSLGKCFPARGHEDDGAAAAAAEDAPPDAQEFGRRRRRRRTTTTMWPIRSEKGRGRRGRGSRPNGPSAVAEKFVTSPSLRRGPRTPCGRPRAAQEPAAKKGLLYTIVARGRFFKNATVKQMSQLVLKTGPNEQVSVLTGSFV